MTPDSSKHNPDPQYLRQLIGIAGVSQRAAAEMIGVSGRMMRHYLAPEHEDTHRSAPYYIQFALESMAADRFAIDLLERAVHPDMLARLVLEATADPATTDAASLVADALIARGNRAGLALHELMRAAGCGSHMTGSQTGSHANSANHAHGDTPHDQI